MPVRRTPSCPPVHASQPAALDAGWLRSLLRHAVRCSLASSLALAGCEAGSGDPALGERPAVLRKTLVAECEAHGWWHLARGFQLANTVDYIADRIDSSPTGLLSERGEACASANDRATCESALALPAPALGRHLVTTEGDEVRLWSFPAVLTLFGAVDTPEEAIWLAVMNGYDVLCDSKVGYINNAFSISAHRPGQGCPPEEVTATVLVSANGATRETMTHTVQVGQGCVTEGRRPEGLRSQHRPRGQALLGEHFAAMAHMEAASVPAFAAIANELRSYCAPAALVQGAERALRDEVRHARITARLAQRFGAQAVAPVVERMPLRSLEDFALDNAVEGCVNETYAAAEAAYRSARASDRSVASALAGIAADEARHAELSWAIARWVSPQLGQTARTRIRAAQREAVAELGDKLRAQVHPELCARAGVPDTHAARTLHARLARTLWQA